MITCLRLYGIIDTIKVEASYRVRSLLMNGGDQNAKMHWYPTTKCAPFD